MRSRNVRWAAWMVFGALGCGASPDAGSAESNVDEAPAPPAVQPISGVLARCTVTAGAEPVEFRVDVVHCEAESSNTLPLAFLLSANVHAKNASIPFSFSENQAADGRVFAKDAYPLQLGFHAFTKGGAPSPNDVQQLDEGVLDQTVTLDGPTKDPIVFRLPYDFWPVTVRATQTAFFERDDAPIELAPWSAESGSKSRAIIQGVHNRITSDTPAQMFFAVAPNTTSVDVHFKIIGGFETVQGHLDGPGAWVLGATGLQRDGSGVSSGEPVSVVPTSSFGDSPPETFLGCHLGDDTLDGQHVFCTPRVVENVTYTIINLVLHGADGKEDGRLTSPALTSVEVGRCVHKPCSVEANVAITHIGDKQSFDVGTLTMPLAGTIADAPALVRLPYDVWTANVDLRGKKVVLISLDSEGPYDPSWTSRNGLSSASKASLSFSTTTTGPFVFAVPIGKTSLTGEMTSINVDVEPKVVVKTPIASVTRGGSYQVDDSLSLVPAP